MSPSVTRRREGSVLRGLDLALVLAQLRLDPGEAKRRVQGRLSGPVGLAFANGNRLGRALSKEAVFVEQVSHPPRASAQRGVVLPGSGEMEERRRERLLRNDPQVGRQAVEEANRRLGVSRAHDLDDVPERAKPLRQLDGPRRGGHEVDVRDHFQAAPEAAGDGHTGGQPGRLQRRRDGLGTPPGESIEKPARGSAHEADPLEDVLHALRAEAADPGQTAVEARAFERLEGIDSQGLVEGPDLLRAQPGDPEAVAEAGRKRRAQLLEERELSRGHERLDVGEDGRADAGHLEELPRAHGLCQVALEGQDRAGAVLVRADLEGVRARELQHPRDLLEDARDLLALHQAILVGVMSRES